MLAQSRIKEYDGACVTFEYADKTEGVRKPKRMTVEAFIGRLVAHIHDQHFRQIRHSGIYATRTRQEDIARARALLNQEPAAAAHPMTWQERRRVQNGYDPLICHRCQVPLTLVAVAYRSRDGPVVEHACDN